MVVNNNNSNNNNDNNSNNNNNNNNNNNHFSQFFQKSKIFQNQKFSIFPKTLLLMLLIRPAFRPAFFPFLPPKILLLYYPFRGRSTRSNHSRPAGHLWLSHADDHPRL